MGMFSRHTEARDARNVAVFELVEAFTEANIPLEKLVYCLHLSIFAQIINKKCFLITKSN